jgi:hypothetical protein
LRKRLNFEDAELPDSDNKEAIEASTDYKFQEEEG